MTTLNITQLRPNLREVADRVRHHGERICVQRNGEPVFALVSWADLELLEALEDKCDLEDALKALKEPGGVALEDLEKQLGL